jgi:diguanylate cyclase (GGDEF)-like protein
MTTSSQSRSSTNARDPWRVILVGRTGLDQTLRRDPQIELIRCRDTIEAIGELSDPIDHESPAQAVVIVNPDALEDDDREHKGFINALRLIDPAVAVLRVSTTPGHFDACVQRDQSLTQLINTIAACSGATPHEPVTLRFIDAQPPEPEPVHEPAPQAAPDPIAEPEPKPEVTVVVNNDTFEHRAQVPFEQEDDIHKRVIMGTASGQPLEPNTPHTHQAPVVHDDEPVVMALLRGKPILTPALTQINTRLGRTDIDFHPSDGPGAALGVPVVVGDRAVGVLSSEDQPWLNAQGRALLARHAQWLASWIKLEAQQSELRKCAFTDTLTGAWNRRYFDRFLTAAIDQSRIARRPLTVMIFDIDSFKHYNDTYGHGAGDEILIETVRLLKSVIRPSDRVCRVGGDEFAVIFYEPEGPRDPSSKPLESIYQIACRFQQQICQHQFPKLGNEAMGTLTVSGGLASYPWDGHDANSLLEQADRLAMESKRQGKNAITLGPGADSVCHIEH